MTGKIIKGIAGFYYVHTAHGRIYECKAKGIFRNRNQKPLIGDYVEVQVEDERRGLGNIVEIKKRTNELIRPAVANVDQSLVVFSIDLPKPNRNLLDRFLIMMEYRDIPCGICLQKSDLDENSGAQELKKIYEAARCPVFITSVKERRGTEELIRYLSGKTTVLAGPSGVGKSSLLNILCGEERMETGEVSKKIGRGRHTTRHTELFALGDDTYLFDTPGFTSFDLPGMEPEDLRYFFPEFRSEEERCRYRGCLHLSEPGCRIKELVAAGKIDLGRYESYCSFYKELRERQKY